MYEGSCHYSIKMYVPSHDSVRVMYMGMKVSATIILTCMCQDRKMFGSCICMRVPATILLRCMCHARTMFVSCIRYVYEGSCHYSINMYVPRQENVLVMYMCMRVPANMLRCMFQARTMFRVMYMCMRVPVTIILRCTLIHIPYT